MLTIVQSIYNKNPLISFSAQSSIIALDSLGIDYQYILYNDKGDVDLINDIPEHIKAHPRFEYHYSKINFGCGAAPGGMVGAIDLVKYPYVLQSNQDDFYTASFYSLALDILAKSESNIAGVCSNCYHITPKFEILKIALPAGPEDAININKAWSNPDFMFDWMFGIDGNKLTRSNNFLYHPGTIFKKELYKSIGRPDIKNFWGSADFEYWARSIFNGYSFQYCSLPTWSYMESAYSHSSIDNRGENKRQSIYNPRIKEKYERLWSENGFSIRNEPQLTEESYWEAEQS